MDLKTLNTHPSVERRPDRIRVGRGGSSGLGKQSGRGNNGAKCRSGWVQMLYREGGQMPLLRRLPKRGFGTNQRFKKVFSIVNVVALDAFDDGAVVSPEALLERGLIPHLEHPVKILGLGDAKKKLTIQAHAFSQQARAKIEAAGGKVVTLGGAAPHRRKGVAKPPAKKEKRK